MHRRPPRRLPTFNYTGPLAYSVRFCTSGRRRLFTDAALVNFVLLQFLRAARESGMAIVAYCFMPDHVHLLIVGERPESNARMFIARAKQYSGHAYSKAFGLPLWQRFAYERVLRSSESLRRVARYILANPQRAGLVNKPQDYPFSGSFTHDVVDLLDATVDRNSRC